MALGRFFGRDQAGGLQQVLVGTALEVSRNCAAGGAQRNGFRSRRQIPRPRERALHALFPGGYSAVPVSSRLMPDGRGHRAAAPLLDLREQGSRREARENAGDGTEPAMAGGVGNPHRRETDGCRCDLGILRAAPGVAGRTEQGQQNRLVDAVWYKRRVIVPKKSGSGISRRDFIKTTGAGALTAELGPFFLFPTKFSSPAKQTAIVGEASVQELKKQLRGELLGPGDGGYNAARSVWNAMVDRRPALIIRCAGVADVINSVNFARTNNLPVSVGGGGHNVAGSAVCDDGIMLDLSRLKSVRVDPMSRTGRAEPGLVWGEFDRETQAFGLATTGGTCSKTGIAGLTLGGGYGWLMRKYGLALDNLVSVDVIGADGQLRKAGSTENADLFFGVRGAHSNFGVVTSLEYRLHLVGPTVLAGMVLHPLEKAREALKFYRKYNSETPDEMNAWAVLLTSPDGHPMLAILACYIGPIEAGEKVVRPLKEFGPPVEIGRASCRE